MTLLSDRQTLYAYERNAMQYSAQIFQADGVTPQNLSAPALVEFYVKTSEYTADNDSSTLKLTSSDVNQISIDSAPNGQITIKIPSNASVLAKSGTLWWRLDVLLDGNAATRKTSRYGDFAVRGM